MRGWTLTLLSLIFFSLNARAEYRVYVLTITDAQSGQSRVVTSTLDDIQYPGYYHVRRDEKVILTDTWMCWGRQGELEPMCPNPRPSSLAPSTSSTNPAPAAPPAR
jgi:hypothetical protein